MGLGESVCSRVLSSIVFKRREAACPKLQWSDKEMTNQSWDRHLEVGGIQCGS